MTGKIKVIKRNEVSEPEKPAQPEQKSKRQSAREAVSTVTNWVTEFQARKRDETKAAIDTFLAVKQPSEL